MADQDKTYIVTAPVVVLGEGSAATYMYRGGFVPAGFATADQIEHHLAIGAIEEVSVKISDEGDPAEEVDEEDEDGKPTDLLDGRSFDEWGLKDLRELVKAEGIALEGATSKADVYRRVLAARAAK